MKGRFLPYLFALAVAVPFSCHDGAIDANPRSKATHLRIQLKTEGGVAFIPRLSQPVTIDSSRLSEEQRGELRRFIDDARFFDLPDKLGVPPPGAADYQRYTITVEEGGRRHTVEFTDFAEDQALRKLLVFLKTLPSEPE